jgi:branched-chain amino acid transport system permease protein
VDAQAVTAPDTEGIVLETRGLTKCFGGLVAVDGLSMTVPRGQIRGLIGPNGSGKTTTVNVLSGLYRPDGG